MMLAVPPKKPKSHLAAIVAVVVVVGIAGLALYVLANNDSIQVTVDSTHITNTVSVAFFVDGNQFATGSLSPGYSLTETDTLYGQTFCSSHTVEVVSNGGGAGSEQDSGTVEVCPGQTQAITLAA